MAYKMSGLPTHPTPGISGVTGSKAYLPPSGGGTGLLGPKVRRSNENLKPAATDGNRVLERKYIENLQQQVYYLELELKHVKRKEKDRKRKKAKKGTCWEGLFSCRCCAQRRCSEV